MRRLAIWMNPRQLWTVEKVAMVLIVTALLLTVIFTPSSLARDIVMWIYQALLLWFLACQIVSSRIVNGIHRDAIAQGDIAVQAVIAGVRAAADGDVSKVIESKQLFDDAVERLDALRKYLKDLP